MPRYRVLIAARLSTKAPKKKQGSQDPDFIDTSQGIGIEVQDRQCMSWAERQGYDVVDVVADIKKGTAAPWERPKLREWVACGCPWCRNEDQVSGRKRPVYHPEKMTEYDAILAWRNDRLSRGAWDDEVKIRQWAEAHGKVLMIKDGPQGCTPSPGSRPTPAPPATSWPTGCASWRAPGSSNGARTASTRHATSTT
jgi:hypothetical protein